MHLTKPPAPNLSIIRRFHCNVIALLYYTYYTSRWNMDNSDLNSPVSCSTTATQPKEAATVSITVGNVTKHCIRDRRNALPVFNCWAHPENQLNNITQSRMLSVTLIELTIIIIEHTHSHRSRPTHPFCAELHMTRSPTATRHTYSSCRYFMILSRMQLN